jgi:large subunit ribosomal protein L18
MKNFIIKFKRRREDKTNYRKRLALLKSDKTRVVVRKSLSNITIQFVNFINNCDQTVSATTSVELKKLGWTRTGNVPAAYLTGLIAGKKAKDKKIDEAILDLGLQSKTKGSRLYAALKGVVDAGVNVPHSEEILPSEDRIKGKHISKEVEKQFEEVKKKIVG